MIVLFNYPSKIYHLTIIIKDLISTIKQLGVNYPIRKDIIHIINNKSGIAGLTTVGKGVEILNMNECPNKEMPVLR